MELIEKATFKRGVVLFQLLEENVVAFVRNELKKFQRSLSTGYPECVEREDDKVMGSEEEEQRMSREALMKITVHFLRKMKHEELANLLHNSKWI